MDKPINLQAPPEVQQRLKSELSSHVVCEISAPANHLHRLKSTRACWKNNFRMAVNGCSIRRHQASPIFPPIACLVGLQFSNF